MKNKRKMSRKQRKGISKFMKTQTGKKGHHYGKPHSEESKKKMSKALKGKTLGEKNGMWKGKKATYDAFHRRVSSWRGKPIYCEICGRKKKDKRFHWTNLTGDYTNINDYKRMCVPCHSRYDSDKRYKAVNDK
jgi:hypothetical protein